MGTKCCTESPKRSRQSCRRSWLFGQIGECPYTSNRNDRRPFGKFEVMHWENRKNVMCVRLFGFLLGISLLGQCKRDFNRHNHVSINNNTRKPYSSSLRFSKE